MTFKVVNSKTAFKGRIFEVRSDDVQLPDGRQTQFHVVVHAGAVVFIPIDEKGRIWFVRQYRHAIGKELLELPAGTLEAGEEPEVTAARESREEIGMSPGKLELLGAFYLAPGYSSEYVYIYLATELRPDPLAQDADEQIAAERRSIAETEQLVRSGAIQDAKTLAALHLAEQTLAGWPKT